jgi:hypothetical protein
MLTFLAVQLKALIFQKWGHFQRSPKSVQLGSGPHLRLIIRDPGVLSDMYIRFIASFVCFVLTCNVYRHCTMPLLFCSFMLFVFYEILSCCLLAYESCKLVCMSIASRNLPGSPIHFSDLVCWHISVPAILSPRKRLGTKMGI